MQRVMRKSVGYALGVRAAGTVLLLAMAAMQTVSATEEAPTIYHGATLIDGTGAEAREGWSIVVRGERIESVVPDAQAPAGERVDMSGLYVLPGLIDTHVHLATPPNAERARGQLERQLYSGITAVRSMADDLRSVAELSRQSLTGEIAAPDIIYAALMAGPGFFDDPRTIAVTRGGIPGRTPWMQAIDEDTDLALAVAMARGTSASGIKIYADLPGSLVRAIVEEAHRQGVPVWAHAAVFPATPLDGVQAGVDVVSHSCSLGYQVSAHMPQTYSEWTSVDEEAFADDMPEAMVALFDEMVARGTVLDATNRVHVEHVAQYSRNAAGRPPRCGNELTYRLTRQAWLQGVPITAGTDGETPPDAPYPALHEELEMLAGPVGMPAADVIAAATRVAAGALGQAVDMGTIEAGKRANLVFVREDPLQDVANLRSVVLTVKSGRAYPRDDYRAPAAEAEER